MMNGLHTFRYLEWVLTEAPKDVPRTPEGWARFLPWSDEVPSSCRLRPGEAVGDPTAPPADTDGDASGADPDPLAL